MSHPFLRKLQQGDAEARATLLVWTLVPLPSVVLCLVRGWTSFPVLLAICVIVPVCSVGAFTLGARQVTEVVKGPLYLKQRPWVRVAHAGFAALVAMAIPGGRGFLLLAAVGIPMVLGGTIILFNRSRGIETRLLDFSEQGPGAGQEDDELDG